MIKITFFADNYCTVLFEVEPIRPAQIWEGTLGIAIATELDNDYHMPKEGNKIFRKITSIPCSKSIDDLKEMKEKAQEEFSLRIVNLKKKLANFMLLKKLTEKEEKE